MGAARGQAPASLSAAQTRTVGQDSGQKHIPSWEEVPSEASPRPFSHSSVPAAAPRVQPHRARTGHEHPKPKCWQWEEAAEPADSLSSLELRRNESN